MRVSTPILALPNSILYITTLFAIPIAGDVQWPYNLPKHVKYFPEDEPIVKRKEDVRDRIAWQKPNGVRKMTTDDSEMFFLDYWQFEGTSHSESANASSEFLPQPAFRPVHDSSNAQDYFLRFAIRDILQKRDFQCPSGTRSCASIDRPNSCCGSSDVCILIEDTGLGDVGCCASGSSCAGTISTCDTDAGYTSCPDSPNGGCCIPGYSCQDVGCIAINTEIVTPTPSPPPPPSTSQPSTTPSSSASCSSGFRLCPASEGGGCCPTDRACGSQTCPPLSTAEPTTTESAAPPVRPTSEASSMITSNPESSLPPDACPTGFYMCSAFYRGGCCRVGRDCDSTSCPATNTIVLSSNGVVIGAPPGATVAANPTSNCASGWFGCDADQGGGCCPDGYTCGGDVCSAAPSGASDVAKEPPSMAANINALNWLLLGAGWSSGLLMFLL